MKIVLTCGHANSCFQLVHGVLDAAGVTTAQPSRRENLTPAEYYSTMFRAHDQDPDGLDTKHQLSPGKTWEELAADLVLANVTRDAWGWADTRTVWTLDFWAAFDSQTRFVLVYCSPEFAVGQALRCKVASQEMANRLVETWTACNVELMNFYNRHPDRCVLINVSSALRSPLRLVKTIADRFEMNVALANPEYQADVGVVSAIASILSRTLIADCDEANALYRELESSADIDSGLNGSTAELAFEAWREYASLVSAITETKASVSENVRQMTLLQAEIENSKYQLAMSVEQHETERAIAGETMVRLSTELEQLKLNRDELQRSLTMAQAELPRLTASNSEISQENELMLMQLHQMQGEVEELSQKNKELLACATSATQIDPLSAPQQSEAFVDMTGPIEGSNWYYAEHDGRWAGPHHTSTIRIPALMDGTYDIWLDIVDAKAPEILAGMGVSLNGVRLNLIHDGEGVVSMSYAQFSTGALAKSRAWEFQFKFPKLISPSEHGSEDLRILAVRLKSLRLAHVG